MTDPLPDPRFPVPSRPTKPEKSPGEPQYFPEIDINATRCVTSDGRPALIENWFDCDTETFCRTFYYSTMEAEDWDEHRHYQFLKGSGLLEDKARSGESAGMNQIEDEAGLSWWVATVTIREEED